MLNIPQLGKHFIRHRLGLKSQLLFVSTVPSRLELLCAYIPPSPAHLFVLCRYRRGMPKRWLVLIK